MCVFNEIADADVKLFNVIVLSQWWWISFFLLNISLLSDAAIVSRFSDFQARVIVQEILTSGGITMKVWNQKGLLYDKLVQFQYCSSATFSHEAWVFMLLHY